MLYVIGHKAPDTDSICSAIAYADFLRKKGLEAEPARAGEINPETKFVLEKFNADPPKLLENADGKKLVLVDHNEKEQMIEGEPEIVEVLDHHKINFHYSQPIEFQTKPLGSTATIIALKFFEEGIEPSLKIKGLLLSAILSDTVIFRSPTTTEKDREIAQRLNEELKFDLENLGKEIKKAGMDLDRPAKNLILRDFKEYTFGSKKFGIGQIEIVEIEKILGEREKEILKAMEEVKTERGYHSLIFAITDIIKKGSQLFVLGEEDKIKEIFGIELKNNSGWVSGLISRKKQIVPPLEKAFGGS